MITALGWLMVVVLLAILAIILANWVREYRAAPVRWPRTRKGWRTLFWLFLNRCPIDHTALREDPWSGAGTLYCLKCEGITMWPADAITALRQNHMAEQRKVPGPA